MNIFFDKKNTIYYDGLGILEAVSSLALGVSGGDQMMPQGNHWVMPQGIIRNSLGDASRHHQGVRVKRTISVARGLFVTLRLYIYIYIYIACWYASG